MSMMKTLLAPVLVLVAFVAPARDTRAEFVDLVPVADNTLFEDPNGTLSNGAGLYLFAGRVAPLGDGLRRRALLRFDVNGDLPADAVVLSATLTLFMSKTVALSQPAALHLATSAWGEGASNAPLEEGVGAPAQSGDATWIHTFFPATTWSSPGGDFDPNASATTSVGSTGFYDWSSPTLAADVQLFYDDPNVNHGWILIGNESVVKTAKRFDSREQAPGSRPRLEIEFNAPVICGDGFTAESEGCDDGNNEDGDGCTADCLSEGGGIPVLPESGLILFAALLLVTSVWLLRGRLSFRA